MADFVIAQIIKLNPRESRLCDARGAWLRGVEQDAEELPTSSLAAAVVPSAVQEALKDWLSRRQEDLVAIATREFNECFGQLNNNVRLACGRTLNLRVWRVDLTAFRWRYVGRRIAVRSTELRIPWIDVRVPIPTPKLEAGSRATEGRVTVVNSDGRVIAMCWDPKPRRAFHNPFVISFKSADPIVD